MISLTVESITPDQWCDSGLFLQTAYWARLKERFGWRPDFLRTEIGSIDDRPEAAAQESTMDRSFCLLMLSRTVAPGILLSYVPGGPPLPQIAENARSEFLSRLGSQIADSTVQETPTAIRFDLPWDSCKAPQAGKLQKSPVDIQPPDTVVLDVRQGEDALLAGMKNRCRRNIRKSEKRGVRVVESKSIDDFYVLYRQTAQRDRIAIHSREYYQAVLDEADDSVSAELLVAQVDNENIAAIIVAYTATEAVYLYGASGNRHRDAMPAYALQWEALKRARSRGCARYDLFGIPPTDDPAHPMHGLLLFKTGFGGQTVHRAGCWDYPVQPVKYFLFRGAERARQFYYKRIRKRQ